MSPDGDTQQPEVAKGGGTSGFKSRWQTVSLPPWISTNLHSRRGWKMLARCWVASWVAFVILLPDASLRTLGNTAFFALLASLMAPPSMPLQLFIFALATMIVGLCLGWALGAAAMACALAARNQLLLSSELQRVAQSAAGLANPDALFEKSIFAGDFLDTHSSVLFGVFLGLGVFAFALIRAYAPRLTIMSIFGTIAIDIYCSYGPLFPFAQYTLLTSLLTSLACYMAIGLVVIIFIFPETLNHAALMTAATLLEKIENIICLQEEVLSLGTPQKDNGQKVRDADVVEQLAEGGSLLLRLAEARDAMLGVSRAFADQLPMLNLEFSWGKWSGDDIKSLQTPVLNMVGRVAAMQGFAKILGKALQPRPSHPTRAPVSTRDGSAESSESTNVETTMDDTRLFRQLLNHRAPDQIPIAELLPILRSSTTQMRTAIVDTLLSTRAVLESVNTRRYKRDSTAHLNECLDRLDTSTQGLNAALDAFKTTDRLALLEPFSSYLRLGLEDALPRHGSTPLRSLFIAYVFTTNVVVVGIAVCMFAESVGSTARKRQRNRLWAPGATALGKVLGQRRRGEDEDVGGQAALGEEPDIGGWEREEEVYRRDPDGRPPANPVQYVMNMVRRGWVWARTPEALFAFKMTFLTIALWIPQVCRTTAEFVYAQKGLWALIMAQTTLNVYAADQIFNIFARLIGTFIGLVLGLLSWYLGSAKGIGSPYGMATVVAVFLVPVLFLRLFAPPQYLPGVLLSGVTWALIVGYSWLDGHIAVLGDVGIGWPVAWRRFVLVTIGVAASSIMMILPPQSARRSVRLRCASVLSSLSYLYSHLMAAWISPESSSEAEKGGSFRVDHTKLPWVPEFRDRFIEITQQLRMLRAQAGVAKLEGNIRGKWPAEEFKQLVEVESEMTWALGVLGGSLTQLDDETRKGLLKHTIVVHPNFIGDVMSAFLLMSQSLRTGEPLHQAHYRDLVERAFYHSRSYPITPGLDAGALRDSHLRRLQSVTTYEYMFYASSVVAVFRTLEALSEARTIVANLCGEVPLAGFDLWKQRFEHDQMV